MNGEYDLNREIFFSFRKVVKEIVTRNCLREDSDVILESMLFVTELLTTGTHCPQVMLSVILLTLLRSISRLNWNWELYSFIQSGPN